MATKKPVIHLEDDDFGAVLNCAVRYALGRRTYMPHLVIGFINPLLPYLTDKTLWCFKRDVEECKDYGDPDIDQEMVRKRYNGRLEDLTAFQKRKYCSLSCANTRKGVTDAALRWRAEQLRKESCENCGAQSRLHAHHIDGNIHNNTPENIQTLCFNCHMAHHRSCRKRGLTVPGKKE